jgi:uncharacterized protein (TIGR00269 family)
VATGHNLDDEAAVLLGNVLHWHTEYLGRQRPTLAERIRPRHDARSDGRSGPEAGTRIFPRKVKPLVRLTERETAAYCVLRGIDYIVEECPMAEGNRHLRYKEALNLVEAASPGAKQAFYFGFLARAAGRFAPEAEGADRDLLACACCGSPTTGEVCAFCRLIDQVAGHDPVPVELVHPRRGGRRSRPGARP